MATHGRAPTEPVGFGAAPRSTGDRSFWPGRQRPPDLRVEAAGRPNPNGFVARQISPRRTNRLASGQHGRVVTRQSRPAGTRPVGVIALVVTCGRLRLEAGLPERPA